MPIYYSTDLSATRSIIKHSWLENEILVKSEERICCLWQDGEWEALNRDFPEREKDAEKLGKAFVEAFSPAALLDELSPLAKLPESIKVDLRERLHREYLETTRIDDLKKPYQDALHCLRIALGRLREAWNLPRSTGGEKLREAARELRSSVVVMIEVIEKIPKGIVIP